MTDTNQCYTCPAGKYCSGGLDAPDGDCAVGYYCREGSQTATAAPCPPGTYSSDTGLKSETECKVCPLGQYCTGGDTVEDALAVPPTSPLPLDCPVGTFGNYPGLGAIDDASDPSPYGCKTCLAGYKCDTPGLIKPVACGKGFYSAAAAQLCEDCPEGYYCDLDATSDTDKDARACGDGFLCGLNTAEQPYHISAYSCLPGYYCTGNVQTMCAGGTYQPLYGAGQADDCLDVPNGHYTVDGVPPIEYYEYKCLPGFYCTSPATSEKSAFCAEKTFRFYEMGKTQDDCGKCPSGYYCPQQTAQPHICPRGYYCPENIEIPIPCPIGTFGAGEGIAAEEDCTKCYGGRYCSQYGLAEPDGLCDAAYYCVDQSMTPVPTTLWVGEIGNLCEAGGYCPTGTKYPKPCLPGFYNDQTGATDSSSDWCQPCPQGKYCTGDPDPGRSDLYYDSAVKSQSDLAAIIPAANPTGDCDAGYYCDGQSSNPRQHMASPGHYTLSGAWEEEDCLAGEYQSEWGQSSCKDCPLGRYCKDPAMTYPETCGPGTYCGPTTRQTGPTNCPEGTYSSLDGLQQESDCWPCKGGSYCGAPGLDAVSGPCTPGYWCQAGAIVAAPPSFTADAYGPCPHFHFCEAEVGYGNVCGPGTYGDDNLLAASSECDAQTAGSYAHSVSTESPASYQSPTMTTGTCHEGYYCPGGDAWPKHVDQGCAVGEYCEAGAVAPVACDVGQYQRNKLQGKCLECPWGHSCYDSAVSTAGLAVQYRCPPGYWCPEGTDSDPPANACPKGTYQPKEGARLQEECIPAPPGYYIATEAATAFSDAAECNQGHYCKLGSWTPTPGDGAADPAGLIYTDYGGVCQPGYYCPAGSAVPLPCTPGY